MPPSFILSRPTVLARPLQPPLSPRHAPSRTPRTGPGTPCTSPSMQAAPPPHAWRAATEAAVDDFIASGMNVCIGHGAASDLNPLLDALDAHAHVDTKVDMAYYATTPDTTALLRHRDLPHDPTVNFKSTTDLYIAAVPAVDAACNALLTSPDLVAERTAAETADRVVLLVPERSFLAASTTFSTIPVELSAFAPAMSLKLLRDMRDLGVLSVDLRDTGNNEAAGRTPDSTDTHASDSATTTTTTRTPRRLIADLTLSASAHAPLLADELSRLPFVVGVGVLPASARTTVIVAADDGEPFDVTPVAAGLAGLDEARRTGALSVARRGDALQMLPAWRFEAGHPDRLYAQFVFGCARRAAAFVRLVDALAVQAKYAPSVRRCAGVVDVSVASPGADGITQADVMFATEVSNTHARVGKLA